MNLAVVVQRYGPAINGGAELHARYIAEHLARHASVEVVTTCATDYVTWRNELPPGVDEINGLTVRRFPVDEERDPTAFGLRSEHVFKRQHSLADELEWLRSEGPTSSSLVKHISRHSRDFDYWIFFSYRYYHTFHGVRAAGPRAILVPTAERDGAIGLSLFQPIFRGVRALMYNSPEERAMIQTGSGNHDVPSVVVGIGSDVPQGPQPARFRQKFNVRGPFAVYVGRIDENKGCKELFDFFETYTREEAGRLSLVLIGNTLLPIPANPRIRHLGFLEDTDKFDAMAAADLLIMPSYFESLSMVALEAWALGRPVVVNGRCDVLKGQSIRSNAGLYYESRHEFVETLRAVEQNRWIAAALGRNGRRFFKDHYDWPVIERKYLDMLQRLSHASNATSLKIEPLPGWFARRRPTCAPAEQVVRDLPTGPQRDVELNAPLTADRSAEVVEAEPLPARDTGQSGRPAARRGPFRHNRPRRAGGA